MADELELAHAAEDDVHADEAPAPQDGIAAIAFACLVLLVGVTFFIESLSIHSQAVIWPRILSIALILLSGAQLASILFTRLRHARAGAPTADTTTAQAGWQLRIGTAGKRRLLTAAWLLAYAVIAQHAGFGPAMLVFVPVYMWFAGYRRPVWIAVITVGFAICLTWLFTTVAGVPMWDARP